MQVYAKLTGVHKGAVTALLPMGSLEPGGPDRLISAGIDGTIAVRQSGNDFHDTWLDFACHVSAQRGVHLLGVGYEDVL